MLTTYILGCFALIIKSGPDLMCTLATALSEGKGRACTLMAGLILYNTQCFCGESRGGILCQ